MNLAGTCDIVSVHVRLKPETRGSSRLRILLPWAGMRFVNTSRAGLIEEGAMLAALEKGRPGKAALDVFDVEPITAAADPLATHPG